MIEMIHNSFYESKSINQTLSKKFLQHCLAFPENSFIFVTPNTLFKRSEHSFQSSKLLQNHFLRSSLYPSFDLNSFERFASLSQKMVSTQLLKNLQKSQKCPFQTLKTFDFELIVASKRFPEKVDLKTIERFFSFQLCRPKICKNLKNGIFKGSQHSVLT